MPWGSRPVATKRPRCSRAEAGFLSWWRTWDCVWTLQQFYASALQPSHSSSHRYCLPPNPRPLSGHSRHLGTESLEAWILAATIPTPPLSSSGQSWERAPTLCSDTFYKPRLLGRMSGPKHPTRFSRSNLTPILLDLHFRRGTFSLWPLAGSYYNNFFFQHVKAWEHDDRCDWKPSNTKFHSEAKLVDGLKPFTSQFL